jgi:hypothetical protein
MKVGFSRNAAWLTGARCGHDRQQGTIINPEPILKLLQATFFQAVVHLTFLLDQFVREIGEDELALVFGKRCRKRGG